MNTLTNSEQESIQGSEDALNNTQALLAALETTFNGIVANTLGAGPGPEHEQIVAYGLAMAKAELYAANSLCRYGLALAQLPDNELEIGITRVGCAALAMEVKSRLEGVLLAAGQPIDELAATMSNPTAQALLGRSLSSTGIEALGRAVSSHESYGRSLLDEENQIVANSFLRFADEVVGPLAEKIHREDLIVPEAILAPMREMGCFGLSIPERFGGSAPQDREDHLNMVIVTEELSRASLAAAGSLITRPEIMAKAVLHGGTEAQRQTWLPRIASGETLCGIAVTEPDAGSDVAQMRLKATRTNGGWLLDGAKTWSTLAGKASLLLVLARTDPDLGRGHKGLNLFLVEKPTTDEKQFAFTQDSGGKLEGGAIPTIGYRGMHSYTLFFDQWFVPDDCLIGGEQAIGKGFYQTMIAFAGGRLQTAARANGLMRAAFRDAILYARDRSVFGQPLIDYQLTLAKIAKMAWLMRACQEMTYDVARLMDNKQGQVEASLVKLFACRAAEYVTREALQIHGGMGYSEETAASRYYVDARVLSIFEGAEETLALKVVAKSLVQ